MNGITIFILAALLGDLLINGWADHLNLKSLRHELPPEFKDVYDPDRYKLSQEYLKVNTRFGWLVSLVNTIGLLVFWFVQGFQFLDVWVRSLTANPIIGGVVYIGILALTASIASLPFSIYATFVIEERFGFNRMNWQTFVKDRLKGMLLGLILGAPLLAGVLAFFEYAGNHAWLYCWMATTVYGLVVQFIAPAWIMPLFNKFTPLEEGELRSTIVDYARSIHFPLDNIFVMDGSRRSKKSNAFFTGFGRYRRIVLFDTLLEKHTPSELLAVLAHEMGHYKKRHIFKSFVLGVIQSGVMFYLLSFFISYPGLHDAFFMEKISVYAGLIFFAMLYAPFELFLGIFFRAFSRKNEFEADQFSIQTTGNPTAMTAALKKLTVDNLANLLPHPFYVFLNYSHPPVMQRIRAINHFSSLLK